MIDFKNFELQLGCSFGWGRCRPSGWCWLGFGFGSSNWSGLSGWEFAGCLESCFVLGYVWEFGGYRRSMVEIETHFFAQVPASVGWWSNLSSCFRRADGYDCSKVPFSHTRAWDSPLVAEKSCCSHHWWTNSKANHFVPECCCGWGWGVPQFYSFCYYLQYIPQTLSLQSLLFWAGSIGCL